MSKRIQTSLNFETQEELEVFEELVKPLKTNNQLRQTLISLLTLYHKYPAVIEGLHRGGEVTVADPDTQALQDKVSHAQTKLDLFGLYLANIGDTVDSLSPANIDATLNNFKQVEATATLGAQGTHGTQHLGTTDEVDDIFASLQSNQSAQVQPQNQAQPLVTDDLRSFIVDTIKDELAEVKDLLRVGVQAPQVVVETQVPTTSVDTKQPYTSEVKEVQEEKEETNTAIVSPFNKKASKSKYELPDKLVDAKQEQDTEESAFDLEGIPSFLFDAASESMV